VHVNGVATRSCQVPVGTVESKQITTIEGLAQNGKLHPVQQGVVGTEPEMDTKYLFIASTSCCSIG
jgi:aerobic-type carbon monoxide dehydrogenase small subunit (CoxS/CutS family)